VNNYMEATFDLLESATDPNLGLPADNNRLVQQWMWFHMAVGTDESGGSSNLLCIANPPGTRDPFPQGCQDAFTNGVPGSLDALTPVGEKFLNEVTSRNTSANLMAGQAHPVAAFTQQPAGTADVILSVDFYNNGNTSINQQFDVTFYKDSGLTQAIGSETINPLPIILHNY
jgi:hypothetical protein